MNSDECNDTSSQNYNLNSCWNSFTVSYDVIFSKDCRKEKNINCTTLIDDFESTSITKVKENLSNELVANLEKAFDNLLFQIILDDNITNPTPNDILFINLKYDICSAPSGKCDDIANVILKGTKEEIQYNKEKFSKLFMQFFIYSLCLLIKRFTEVSR